MVTFWYHGYKFLLPLYRPYFGTSDSVINIGQRDRKKVREKSHQSRKNIASNHGLGFTKLFYSRGDLPSGQDWEDLTSCAWDLVGLQSFKLVRHSVEVVR